MRRPVHHGASSGTGPAELVHVAGGAVASGLPPRLLPVLEERSYVDDDTMTMTEAAAECGLTVEQFLDELVKLGGLERTENGGYLPTTDALLSGNITPARVPGPGEWL